MVVHPKLHLKLVELTESLEGVLELHEQIDQLVIVLTVHRLLPHLHSRSLLSRPPRTHLYWGCLLVAISCSAIQLTEVMDALEQDLPDVDWVFLDLKQHYVGQVEYLARQSSRKGNFGDAGQKLLIHVPVFQEIYDWVRLRVQESE